MSEIMRKLPKKALKQIAKALTKQSDGACDTLGCDNPGNFGIIFLHTEKEQYGEILFCESCAAEVLREFEKVMETLSAEVYFRHDKDTRRDIEVA